MLERPLSPVLNEREREMRLELTRRTDLAIRALRALDGRDQWVPRAELADTVGATPDFLAQVMGPLVRASWVRSRPGVAGGYALAADPRAISVLRLIEEVEGPVVDGRCVLRHIGCPADDHCVLHDAWSLARDALIRELDAAYVLDNRKETSA